MKCIAAMVLGLAFGLAAGAIHAHPLPEAAPGLVEPPMDRTRIERLLQALDAGTRAQGDGWRLRIEEQIVLVIMDEAAGRFRVMVPAGKAADLDSALMKRILSANFDGALDPRYALAEGLVWAVFARSLGGLDKDELISGLAQVVILSRRYGRYDGPRARQRDLSEQPGDNGAARRPEDDISPGAALVDRLLRLGSDI